MGKLISVILPIFNQEKYLPTCLDSLLSQTYQNLEIICVNDGSTDESLKILEKYAKNDSRIIIINQENLGPGPGGARNKGLQKANGEYIGFVDPDDWVEKEMFMELYRLIEVTGVEMVMCCAAAYSEKEKEFLDREQGLELPFLSEKISSNSLSGDEFRKYYTRIFAAPWNKLFRKSYLIKASLSFPERVYYEDQYFFVDIYFSIQSFAFTKKKLYIYRIDNMASIMGGNDKKIFDHFKYWQYRWEMLIKYNQSGEQKVELWVSLLSLFRNILKNLDEPISSEFYEKGKDFFCLTADFISSNKIVLLQKKWLEDNSNYLQWLKVQNEGESFFCGGRIKIKKRKIKYVLFGITIWHTNYNRLEGEL